MDLAHLFRYASRMMARACHGHKGDHGGHHAQGKLLSILGKRGTISQSELLEILDVRSSSLSELLSKLERKGLVTRERNEADRRSFNVTATDAATELINERKQRMCDTGQELFDCLDDNEQETLRELLAKLVTSLKDNPELGKGRGNGRKCKHGHDERGERNGRGRGGRGGRSGRGKNRQD